ncbi:MAG: T9SS type A sorting domain-containing protein, partial [Bacteroidia bacterium]|nr:T9SS type A sorting domain-containing protein [Bacteroidia bacterium]
KQQYQASNKIPVLIAADSILQITLRNSSDLKKEASIKVWPSISNGSVFIQLNAADELKEIYLYSSDGKLEKILKIDSSTNYLQVVLPSSSGVYFLNIRTRKMSLVKKVYRE